MSKNPSGERKLEDILHRLNAEVYCSFTLLQQAARYSDIISYFNIVIISETITIAELSNILSTLRECRTAIIKKGRLDLLGDSSIKENIDGWIDLDMTDEEIFEVISNIHLSDTLGKEVTDEDKNSKKIAAQFMFNLSNNERKFILLLCQAEGNSLSREDMCFGIWKSEVTPSCLSQLSALANRIKIKIAAFGYNEDELSTNWGCGYCLGQSIVTLVQNRFL